MKNKKYLIVLVVFFISFVSFWGICQFTTNSTSNNVSVTKSTTNPLILNNPFLEKNKIIVLKLEGDVSLDWTNKIEKEFKKSECISVIAWIESNGGDVAETKLTTHKISALIKKYNKSLLVYSEKGLYSGAYWVACTANKIVVAPSGETGSIGVFTLRVDETVSDSMSGVKYILIKSGKNKAMYFSHSKLTEEEKKILQNRVDELYHEFLQYVFDCRKNKLTQAYQEINNQTKVNDIKVMNFLENISDGRTYSATNALWFGLIDNVMYFDELVYKIYKNIPNVEVVTDKNRKIEDFYPEE
jgi:signal peptide peptidase SppA